MEVNPTDQTCRSADKPIARARFRRGPGASQASEETWMHSAAKCINCLEMPCRCTSVVSMTTPTSNSSLTQRSGLFGVCLNCPLDDQRPCSSCSAMSAASLERSSVMTAGTVPSVGATKTLFEDEGSVYNSKWAAFSEFQKPSTTTAMTMPAAEEATVYNGKIGYFLFSGNQLGPCQTATCMATDADIRKLPSSSSPTIRTTGAATEEEKTIIPITSLISDYKMSPDKPGQSKRSWQENIMEDGTNQSPQDDEQENSGTAVQLPAQARPGSSSCKKRRKTERRCERVPAVTSEKSLVPPDRHGYIWWKCGQKNIKGFPYPRSYYKCKSGNNCDARREVMRAVDNPSMLDISYIGEHSHASPAAAASDIVPATVPAEPLEESATTKPTDFIEYL